MSPLDHLSPAQRRALDQAVAYARQRYDPWAVLVAGTIVRGNPDRHSDLDLYVLHDQPFRQRVQRILEGTPVEIFVNTEESVRGYLEEEASNGRLFTAHMLSTGVVLHGEDDPRLLALQVAARASLESTPSWNEVDLIRARYAAATLVEDAADRREAEPAAAMMLLGKGVDAMLTYWFKSRGSFIPRLKDIVGEVSASDPDVGELLHEFWGDVPYTARWHAAMELADRVLGTRGFFEWESEQEPVGSSV